jgi:putative heme iron utilization protein
MQKNEPSGEKKKDVIRETDAEAIRLARTLLRSARFGAIAVLDSETGAPLASRVGVATDIDGAPLILISLLAAHTRAILADPRCSLLLGEPGKGDPLAYPRISISCAATKLGKDTEEKAQAERRYLNRHPKAKLYVGLGDFSFFRLEPSGASLNGGFGKAYLLTRADLLAETPVVSALAEVEQSAIDHMNDDHRDALGIYARAFAGADDQGEWRLTGIDPDGLDLVSSNDFRRVFFPNPLTNAAELRKTLVEMAAAGRRLLSDQPT